MKNYLVRLKITCGEYEFSSAKVLKARTEKGAEKKADTYASGFYGDRDRKIKGDGDGHYFNRGEIHVGVKSVREITPEDAAAFERLRY